MSTVHLPEFLASTFGISRSEARRCIAQGGVTKPDGTKITDMDVEANGHIICFGKRRMAQLPTEPFSPTP